MIAGRFFWIPLVGARAQRRAVVLEQKPLFLVYFYENTTAVNKFKWQIQRAVVALRAIGAVNATRRARKV